MRAEAHSPHKQTVQLRVPLQKWGGTFALRGTWRQRMKLKQTSAIELELRRHLTDMFRRVIRRGIRFDPRLVTRNGQIVDKPPTEVDRYLMLAHPRGLQTVPRQS